MKITVRYSGQIRQAAGVAAETIELQDACTAHELVVRLAEDRGEPLRGQLLDAEGALQGHLLLAVRDAQVERDGQAELQDGDEVSIVSPIGGG